MAYDYIGITNEILSALNEVQLTTDDFDSVEGFHQQVKYAVNASIRDIYAEEDNLWPFALTAGTQVLSVGLDSTVVASPIIREYTPPADSAAIDWESFYILRNDSLTNGDYKKLQFIDWGNYTETYRDADADAETDTYGKPSFVTRTPSNKIVVSPSPDQAYTLKFDYYATPVDLEDSTDVPTIPATYRQVLIDRGLHYAYMFRDNIEQAAKAEERAIKGVDRMRRVLIPQPETMRAMSIF